MNRIAIPVPLLAQDPVRWDLWADTDAAAVRAACLEAIAAGTHPGVVGTTTPQRAASVAAALTSMDTTRAAWTARGIEAWRDRTIAGIESTLLGAAQGHGTEDAVTIGLGLCDLRVRDVILLDLITTDEAARAEAGRRLWPVAAMLPAEVRAPAATVLAITEYTAGRPVEDLLDWATEVDADYRLAELTATMASRGIPPAGWLAVMSGLSRGQCRYGLDEPAPAEDLDPLTSADPLSTPAGPTAGVDPEQQAQR